MRCPYCNHPDVSAGRCPYCNSYILSEIEKAKDRIDDLRMDKAQAENAIDAVVRRLFPEYSNVANTLGSWDCDKSPVGLCIYNHLDDPAMDNCIFCGEPHERK